MAIIFWFAVMVGSLMLILGTGFGQSRVLYGIVSGNGQPLPGVSVMIKQSTIGTVTDKDGRFSLDVPKNEGVTLVFSFIGPYTERWIGKHENNIKVKIDGDLGVHAAYLLTGPSVSKLSDGREIQRGFILAIGYRYLYYRFGLGAELSLQQGPVENEHGTIVQVGIPVIGYYRMGDNFIALIGGGFYRSSYGPAQNDFKILGGIQFEKRFWSFGLRYLNGTRKIFENRDGVVQNFQFTIQYRVN